MISLSTLAKVPRLRLILYVLGGTSALYVAARVFGSSTGAAAPSSGTNGVANMGSVATTVTGQTYGFQLSRPGAFLAPPCPPDSLSQPPGCNPIPIGVVDTEMPDGTPIVLGLPIESATGIYSDVLDARGRWWHVVQSSSDWNLWLPFGTSSPISQQDANGQPTGEVANITNVLGWLGYFDHATLVRVGSVFDTQDIVSMFSSSSGATSSNNFYGHAFFIRKGPPGSDGGNWFDKLNDFVVTKVIPAVAIVASFFFPEAAPVIAVGLADFEELAQGKPLDAGFVEKIAGQAASAGGPYALAAFKDGLSQVVGPNEQAALTDALAKANQFRATLDSATRTYADQGISTAIAKRAQTEAVSVLKQQYPTYVPVIDEAIAQGGSLYSIARGIGGINAVVQMSSVISSVQNQAKKAIGG